MSYPLKYHWRNNEKRKALKGKRCRIVQKGSRMYSVLVEFEDGERVVTSIRALREE